MVSVLLLSLLGLASTMPVDKLQRRNLSAADYEFLQSLPSYRGALPAGFRKKYVTWGGGVHDTQATNSIEVAASPGTSARAHQQATTIIGKMTAHMPWTIFYQLTIRASVGVFTKAEKMSVYPEYAHLRDTPQCHNRCSGSCQATCTGDGRKYDSLTGSGGARALINEDNLLCTSQDTYYHHDNILVHEFAHTVQGYGLNSGTKAQVDSAYNAARARQTWRLNEYAMFNSYEYWAEATGAYFNVNHQSSAGGMNECGGRNNYCSSEQAARYHIYQHDTALYNVLTKVYTSGDSTTASGLTICP